MGLVLPLWTSFPFILFFLIFFFPEQLVAFGSHWHQRNMPVVKVASAGRQSNCFDRPGDVQRKCSSIFSCSWSGINTCMAQGDPAVWEFQSCCCCCGWLWSTGNSPALRKNGREKPEAPRVWKERKTNPWRWKEGNSLNMSSISHSELEMFWGMKGKDHFTALEPPERSESAGARGKGR